MKHVCSRMFSTTAKLNNQHFKLIIAGGGAAGASTAHNFINKLSENEVAVIEPSNSHYYQPLWTLVGAGIKTFNQSFIPMANALPKKVKWFQDYVMEFNPDKNTVILKNGTKLTYDYLVVALGIELRYDLIPGAVDALQIDDRVVSNYSKNTVEKTFKAFQSFTEGTALFSFPNTPVKCAGAPQKIMYLFDDYLKMKKLKTEADIQYFTSLPTVFSVKKYSDKLMEICNDRNLKVHTRSHLIEVDPLKHIAKFENIDTKKCTSIEYAFLHITPPMVSYEVIKKSALSDEATGFVAVNKETLQHIEYPNVFALGDCSNLPTSKTAAAIASQQNVVYANLTSLMKTGKCGTLTYDGYTSCPFLTRFGKGVLAEFGYDGKIMETFPFDQARESRTVYLMKSHLMPQLYWHGLIRGRWNGPGFVRKCLHLGMKAN